MLVPEKSTLLTRMEMHLRHQPKEKIPVYFNQVVTQSRWRQSILDFLNHVYYKTPSPSRMALSI